MSGDLKHLERLLLDSKEGLEREMRESFDRIEKVTSRHSGMIVSTVAISTLTKTVTKQESAIRDLQARVRKLEGRRRNGKALSQPSTRVRSALNRIACPGTKVSPATLSS